MKPEEPTAGERSRLDVLISGLVGPAPWYTRTFRTPSTGLALHTYVWRLNDAGGATLEKVGPLGITPIMQVGMYCRVHCVHDDVLVWAPVHDRLVVWTFDARVLERITESRAPYTEVPVVTTADPIQRIEIEADLPQGTHVTAPVRTRVPDEVFLIGDPKDKASAAASILVWQPNEGRATAFPQRWFTAAEFDLGYEWITCVGRDPVSGRLVGEGIRIGRFVLDESGTRIAKLWSTHWSEQVASRDRWRKA